MKKSLFNILGVAILIIILISIILTITGSLPGRTGDFIIMSSSFIIALVILFFIKRNKKN